MFQFRWLVLLNLGCCLLQYVDFKHAAVLFVGFVAKVCLLPMAKVVDTLKENDTFRN